MGNNRSLPIRSDYVEASKTCPHCGTVFHRNPKWSLDVFLKTRFCSHSCEVRARPRPTAAERLEANIMPEPNSGCWLWMGTITTYGYGHLSFQNTGWTAPRLSYATFVGPIQDGLWVLHKCDTPACINPDHLYLGTVQDNARDRVQRDRTPRGARNHASKLTADAVREIRSSTASHAALSRRHGVSAAAIRNVRIKKTWSHI